MIERGSSNVLFIDLQCLVLLLFKISGNLHHIKCCKGISQSLLCFFFQGVSFELFFDRGVGPPCPKINYIVFLRTALLSLHVNVTFIFQELYLIWNINWIDNSRDNVNMILDVPIRKQVIHWYMKYHSLPFYTDL